MVETLLLNNNQGMTVTATAENEKQKMVKSILVTQPKPLLKSPYFDIEQKYGIKIDFREFTHVEVLDIKEVRRQRVNPGEFSSVILNSKNAVDYFLNAVKRCVSRCQRRQNTSV